MLYIAILWWAGIQSSMTFTQIILVHHLIFGARAHSERRWRAQQLKLSTRATKEGEKTTGNILNLDTPDNFSLLP